MRTFSRIERQYKHDEKAKQPPNTHQSPTLRTYRYVRTFSHSSNTPPQAQELPPPALLGSSPAKKQHIYRLAQLTAQQNSMLRNSKLPLVVPSCKLKRDMNPDNAGIQVRRYHLLPFLLKEEPPPGIATLAPNTNQTIHIYRTHIIYNNATKETSNPKPPHII